MQRQQYGDPPTDAPENTIVRANSSSSGTFGYTCNERFNLTPGCKVDTTYNINAHTGRISAPVLLPGDGSYQDNDSRDFLGSLASSNTKSEINNQVEQYRPNREIEYPRNAGDDDNSSQPKKRRRRRRRVEDCTQKVYKCTVIRCGRIFLTAGHLGRHVKSHSGERPFSCPIGFCTSRFSRKDNMIHHYRVHLRRLQNFDIKAAETDGKLSKSAQPQTDQQHLPPLRAANTQFYTCPPMKPLNSPSQVPQSESLLPVASSSDQSYRPIPAPVSSSSCVQCATNSLGIKDMRSATICRDPGDLQDPCLSAPSYPSGLSVASLQSAFAGEAMTDRITSLNLDFHRTQPRLCTIENQLQQPPPHTYIHMDTPHMGPYHCRSRSNILDPSRLTAIPFSVLDHQGQAPIFCGSPSRGGTCAHPLSMLNTAPIGNMSPSTLHLCRTASVANGRTMSSQCSAPECAISTQLNHHDSLPETNHKSLSSPTVCYSAECKHPSISMTQTPQTTIPQDITQQTSVSHDHMRMDTADVNMISQAAVQSTLANTGQHMQDDRSTQGDQNNSITSENNVMIGGSGMLGGNHGAVTGNNTSIHRRSSCFLPQGLDQVQVGEKQQMDHMMSNSDLIQSPSCCTDLNFKLKKQPQISFQSGRTGRADITTKSNTSKENTSDTKCPYGGQTSSQIQGNELPCDCSLTAPDCCPERIATTTSTANSVSIEQHHRDFSIPTSNTLSSCVAPASHNPIAVALHNNPKPARFSSIPALSLNPEDCDPANYLVSKEGPSCCSDADKGCQFLNCADENRLGLFLSPTPCLDGIDCNIGATHFQYTSFLDNNCHNHLLSQEIASVPNQHTS